MFRPALVVAAVCFATVAAAEGLARAFTWQTPAPAADSCTSLYGYSPTGVGDLHPSMNDVWCLWPSHPYRVTTNSIGTRNTEDPRPGSYKIVALGDSMTFGPYLPNEDAWPAWLENGLRAEGRDVQVFNAGIWGFTIADELGMLRQKVLPFRPDLVVVAAFDNDILDLHPKSRAKHDREIFLASARREISAEMKIRAWLGEHIAVYRLASAIKGALRDAPQVAADVTAPNQTGENVTAGETEDLQNQYRATVREFVSTAKDAHLPVAFVHIPRAGAIDHPEDQSRVAGILADEARSLGFHYIDAAAAFTAYGRVEDIYLLQSASGGRYTGNGHLARFGGRLLADTIKASLVKSTLVPPPAN
jgi:lysophospholipase L1-like esterase